MYQTSQRQPMCNNTGVACNIHRCSTVTTKRYCIIGTRSETYVSRGLRLSLCVHIYSVLLLLKLVSLFGHLSFYYSAVRCWGKKTRESIIRQLQKQLHFQTQAQPIPPQADHQLACPLYNSTFHQDSRSNVVCVGPLLSVPTPTI